MALPLVLSAGLLAWSGVANLVVGDAGYVPRNLLLSVALLVLAHRTGLGIGLQRDRLAAGGRWGVIATVVVAAVLAVAVVASDALGPLSLLLEDERAQLPGPQLAWAALVRIPVGTALFEELAFRGVLLSAFLRVTSTRWAVTWSSVVFGLWHVAPTMVALELNGVAPLTATGVGTILGGVAVTAAAGVLFSLLRLGSGSLVAPILAHWATNSLGLLAAAIATPFEG